MDEIRIENLEIYANHGVFPEENEVGQPFFINVKLYTDTRKAGLLDELAFSTHYGEVSELCYHFMRENTFQLIETVAERLAKEILLKFPLLHGIQLEIRKPYAPIRLPFESVSVCIERKWHKVYLSIGSNMGDKERYLKNAIARLEGDSDIRKVKASSFYVTKPYGGVEQEDFVNAAVELETIKQPEELLDFLHTIEAEAHRERKVHWGPRTLDMDILLYDKEIYESEDLIIPHVDMQNRAFVLEPMMELAANVRHPIYQKTISEMLAEVKKEVE